MSIDRRIDKEHLFYIYICVCVCVCIHIYIYTIPVFLPGKFHGQRSLAGYSPWGHKESDMTERFSLTNTRPSSF